MAPVKRSAVADATPSAIWTSCFEPMKWETWDEDIVATENVAGGCADGTTCVFVMNEKTGGMKVPVLIDGVRENESLTFSGSYGIFGMMKFKGTIDLKEVDERKTEVEYSFEIFGWAGPLINMLNHQVIVDGTESGLANIVKISEEAR